MDRYFLGCYGANSKELKGGNKLMEVRCTYTIGSYNQVILNVLVPKSKNKIYMDSLQVYFIPV